MNETDPLLAAVLALVKPKTRKQPQDVLACRYPADTDDNGAPVDNAASIGVEFVRVTIPALLDLLDEAIASSMGGSTRGASLKSEGAPINVAALYEATRIRSNLVDWCRIAGSTLDLRKLGTAKLLVHWYTLARQRGLDEPARAFHTAQLRRIANTIRNMLDPWHEQDLPDPCPDCGADEWWSPTTRERYPRPLVVRYRKDTPDLIDTAHAACRACDETWSARELAWILEHQADAA